MDNSGRFQSLSPPASGVTVVVDLDGAGGQKLTIKSKSKPEKYSKLLDSSKTNPFGINKADSASTTTSADGNKLKRLECVGNHFPELMPDKMSKICFVCSYVTAYSKRKPNGRMVTRHETRYWCPDCEVPLCITPRSCFRRYHTEEQYFMDIEENLYTSSHYKSLKMS